MKPFPFYVGYDQREQAAYDVCVATLTRNASVGLNPIMLHQPTLRESGVYRRVYTVEDGQMVDAVDGRPFSTDFSFTRFLVPHLNGYEGWAAFSDCDFLFTADVAELLALADDQYAVMVVKHGDAHREGVKMHGQVQQSYRRKLWSSLVLWNCGHPANRVLTPEMVNTQPGRWLHGFEWLNGDLIGSLPREWNWIAGETVPKGIHFSLGTPDMPLAKAEYADLWNNELRELRAARASTQEMRASPCVQEF